MKFFKSKIDYYLQDTHVENLFINEYMIHAKGDYVKVYLFALMYANKSTYITNETIAKELVLSVGEVFNAWDYWETQGVIKKHLRPSGSALDYSIEFLSLKQLMFKGTLEESAESGENASLREFMETQEVRDMLSGIEKIIGRTLGPTEFHDIKMWFDDFHMEASVILRAYQTCAKTKKSVKHSYVSAIIQSWHENKIGSIESLEEYLAENDKRHFHYKRIFKALGFQNRMPSEEEKRIMDTWFDEYLASVDTILEACKKTSGISSPNINYINSIIKSWSAQSDSKDGGLAVPAPGSGKKSTASQMIKKYEEIRAKNVKEEEVRKNEIYLKIPRIYEIEKEVKEVNSYMLKLVLAGKKDTPSFVSMQRELGELKKERTSQLQKSHYMQDYLDPIYDCPLCKDTGFLESGERCVCFLAKMQ